MVFFRTSDVWCEHQNKNRCGSKKVAAEFYPALCHPHSMILYRRSTYRCKA